MAVTLSEAAARHVNKFLSRRGKGIGIRVVGRKPDAGEQTVQLCILGGALLAEGGAFGLQALLQPGFVMPPLFRLRR